MSEIKKVNINSRDFKWDKIASTAADAKNENFILEDNILKDYWDDKLELEKQPDGSYLMSQDGVAMGFTDSKTAESYIKTINDSSNNSEILKKTLEGADHRRELENNSKLSAEGEKNNSKLPINDVQIKHEKTNAEQLMDTLNSDDPKGEDGKIKAEFDKKNRDHNIEIFKKTLEGADHRRKLEKADKIAAMVGDSISSKSVLYEKDRYKGTDVWLSVISKDHRPKLGVADGGNYEAPSEIAKSLGASLAINAAPFGNPGGVIYTDGHLVSDTGNPYDETIYMDQNGDLNVVKNDEVSTEQLLNMDPVWASKGFYSIIRDGQYVDENKIDESLSKVHRPRTVIGQTYDGDYIVFACDGDGADERGLSLKEINDYIDEKIGAENVRVLFNFDGGGSSSFVVDGEKQNSNSTDGYERPVPNIIYWD